MLALGLPLFFASGALAALTPTPTSPTTSHYSYFCPTTNSDGAALQFSTFADGVLYCPYGDATASCAYDAVNGDLDQTVSTGSCPARAKYSSACHFTCPSSEATGGTVVWWRRNTPDQMVLECGYAHHADTCHYSVASGTSHTQDGVCPELAANTCDSPDSLKSRRQDRFQKVVMARGVARRDALRVKIMGGRRDGL